MNNQFESPISYIKYANRGLNDQSMNPNLIYEYPDEFYLFIPDIAAPGIKQFSYLISNYGKIYSIDRSKYVQYQYLRGWARVSLIVSNFKNGEVIIEDLTISVHRLVNITFSLYFGKLPLNFNELETNHIDGNKENNSFSNLEWCSTAYNCYHRDNVIEHNIRSLTDEQVIEICNLRKKFGYGRKRIADIVGIDENVVRGIIECKTYKHITMKILNNKEYKVSPNFGVSEEKYSAEMNFAPVINSEPYSCPISCECFSNRKYINPELLSSFLPKIDHDDEFFIYVPDVAIPGVEPYSTMISNYGKLYNLSSNTTITISKNKYGENCANFRRYSVRLKRIVQRLFSVKRIEKISFDFYYNVLPLDFLKTGVKFIDGDPNNLAYHNLIWQGGYCYNFVD